MERKPGPGTIERNEASPKNTNQTERATERKPVSSTGSGGGSETETENM